MRGLSLVAGGHSSSRCADLSLSRPLLLRSTGSRRAGSVVVAHGPSHSAACGISPDQGSNPCPLHWQVDSQPLHHQGSPVPPCTHRRVIAHIIYRAGTPRRYLRYLRYLRLSSRSPQCHHKVSHTDFSGKFIFALGCSLLSVQ